MFNLNKKSIVVGLFLCSIILLICHPQQSNAIMMGLSTEELTGNAEIVVSGKVEKIESLWSEDGRMIFTRAIVAVSDIIKGALQKERIAVEYEGGEIGDTGLKVSDISPLVKDNVVILFLRSGMSRRPLLGQGADDKIYNIVGKAQGKYLIDANGIARKSGFSIISGQTLVDNNMPYHELIDKIRAVK